jgi:hypothetical protein
MVLRGIAQLKPGAAVKAVGVTMGRYFSGASQRGSSEDLTGGVSDVIDQTMRNSINDGPRPIRNMLANIYGKNKRTGILGVNFSIASMLKQSQVFTTGVGTVFQLLGAMIDWVLGKGIIMAMNSFGFIKEIAKGLWDKIITPFKILVDFLIDLYHWFVELKWVKAAGTMITEAIKNVVKKAKEPVITQTQGAAIAAAAADAKKSQQLPQNLTYGSGGMATFTAPMFGGIKPLPIPTAQETFNMLSEDYSSQALAEANGRIGAISDVINSKVDKGIDEVFTRLRTIQTNETAGSLYGMRFRT